MVVAEIFIGEARKMSIKAMGFPGRYIQGPGAINEIPILLKSFNINKAIIILDEIVNKLNGYNLKQILSQANINAEFLIFPGEITQYVVKRLSEKASSLNADIILGFGGGKTIDAAKGIALNCDVPLFIIPTIASNDSPTSRLIVLYNDQKQISRVDYMVRNPDIVIVDTEIISKAPIRFFIAGLGDAISKKFEAEQCFENKGNNFFGTPSLPTARLLAEHCYETIIQYGKNAISQIRDHHSPNEDVERAIEASVLLSGLGFESAGLSLAHGLTRGFTAHPIFSSYLHGEIVAFGSLVQLIAEERDESMIKSHASFCKSIGLPISFADFGIEELSNLELDLIAQKTMEAPYINNISPKLNNKRIIQCLLEANKIGLAVEK